MAKNFGKAASAGTFKEVAKVSDEKAKVITVKMISNENLFDYERNQEDIDYTEDLEYSIKRNGFTDPIEVTGYGNEEGNYTIVSGHRRRAAAVKTGRTLFPCIIKTFQSDTDIYDYVLLANSQRDSARDPLLFSKRYKMHEEYLKSINFTGSVREEISKRLGISVQQADRYNQFNKIILPVWDMVRDGKVGMSSVLPMASFQIDEQEEILDMLIECIDSEEKLNRQMCDKIIKAYRTGIRCYNDIKNIETPVIKDMPLNSFINTEPGEKKNPSTRNRNDEIQREYDPSLAVLHGKDPYADERLTSDDYEVINRPDNQDLEDDYKNSQSEISKKQNRELKIAENIVKNIEKLDAYLGEHYTFDTPDKAETALIRMKHLCEVLIDEMYNVSNFLNKSGKDFDQILNEIHNNIKAYSK